MRDIRSGVLARNGSNKLGTGFGNKAPNGLANTVDDKLCTVVRKLGYMLETLVRPFVLA